MKIPILVAVCDDEKAARDQLRSYFDKHREKVNLTLLDSGEALLEQYRRGARYDMIFLDIRLCGMSGIETARLLRREDRRVLLILLTSVMDYALLGYEVGAFRYLCKPLTPEQFEKVYAAARDEMKRNERKYYAVPCGDGSVTRVSIMETVYLESFGRKISVHLLRGDLSFTASMTAEEKKLTPAGFIRIHKSYLVNLRFVRRLSRSTVELDTGVKLPLSRRKQREVYEAFTRYLAEHTD